MNWITYILEHITAIAAVIGLIYTTVTFVTKAAKEQNWSAIMKLVIADITVAETKYPTGAERKQWVMSMLAAHAKACNYTLTDDDITKISNMIDGMCDMAKTVNAA